ncbi:MAG: hypothetical protein MUP81_06410 [Dehalococcoidia bacterium]|nr:hypothetical protein [Dehalococcoidia bacterium]
MQKDLIATDNLEIILMPTSWALPLDFTLGDGGASIQIFCLWIGFAW